MSLKINNTDVTAVKLGADTVSKIYLGASALYSSVPETVEPTLAISGITQEYINNSPGGRYFTVPVPSPFPEDKTFFGIQARVVGSQAWFFLAGDSPTVMALSHLTAGGNLDRLNALGRLEIDSTSGEYKWRRSTLVNDFDRYEIRLVARPTAAPISLGNLIYGPTALSPAAVFMSSMRVCSAAGTCSPNDITNVNRNSLMFADPAHPLANEYLGSVACSECPGSTDDKLYVDLQFTLPTMEYVREKKAFRLFNAKPIWVEDVTCQGDGGGPAALFTANFIGAAVLDVQRTALRGRVGQTTNSVLGTRD